MFDDQRLHKPITCANFSVVFSQSKHVPSEDTQYFTSHKVKNY